MTQSLYLLRHAKAEPWSPGINDFGRCLSDRGIDHMAQLSKWALENLAAPEITLCSSSCRTRETLLPFSEAWPGSGQSTEFLDEIYEAGTGALHLLAENAFRSCASVFMIGHNPGFEYLAQAVLRSSDSAGINKMATGTMAVIDFPQGYEKGCGEGVLRHWLKRKDL